MTEAWSLSSGSAFCTVEDRTFHVHAENKVHMVFRDLCERSPLPHAGVREQRVHPAAVPRNLLVQAIEIGWSGDIALHPGRSPSDGGAGGIEFLFSPTGEIDMSPLLRQPTGAGETDPRRAAGHYGRLAVELSREVPPSVQTPRTRRAQ
jgi:hypothetical protein